MLAVPALIVVSPERLHQAVSSDDIDVEQWKKKCSDMNNPAAKTLDETLLINKQKQIEKQEKEVGKYIRDERLTLVISPFHSNINHYKTCRKGRERPKPGLSEES